MRTNRFRALLGNVAGSTAVEFALIMPVMFGMLIGFVEWGRYFWQAHEVERVLSDAARWTYINITAQDVEDGDSATFADQIVSHAGQAAQNTITFDASFAIDATDHCSNPNTATITATFTFDFSFSVFLPVDSIQRNGSTQVLLKDGC